MSPGPRMQNVINTVKGKALEVAEYLTPVLKVSRAGLAGGGQVPAAVRGDGGRRGPRRGNVPAGGKGGRGRGCGPPGAQLLSGALGPWGSAWGAAGCALLPPHTPSGTRRVRCVQPEGGGGRQRGTSHPGSPDRDIRSLSDSLTRALPIFQKTESVLGTKMTHVTVFFHTS